jgi:hypothetical protein
MPWTPDYYRIAVPSDMIPLANQVAALFDTDTGGDQTFTVANVGFREFPEGFDPEIDELPPIMPTHCLIRTLLVEGYQDFLGPDRDVNAWHQLLLAKAGGDQTLAPTLEEVQALADVFLFDDECDGLEIIE